MNMKPVRPTEVLRSDRAAVKCTHKFRSKEYVPIEGSIVVIKAGCPVVPLLEDEVVVTSDGVRLNPTGRFFITAQTIDPYHLLLDIF